MALIMFYLLGLIAIGGVTLLCAKACPVKNTAAIIAGWGMGIAVAWIVVGGLIVADQLLRGT